jgi:hypothetical protein
VWHIFLLHISSVFFAAELMLASLSTIIPEKILKVGKINEDIVHPVEYYSFNFATVGTRFFVYFIYKT